MKRGVVVMVAAVAVLVLIGGGVLGAMMTSQATQELDTALLHAKFAAGYNSTAEIELHLHHVVNCIEGKSGKNYFKPSGDVCEGFKGNGLLADLKDSGMAGAHALPYVEIADSVALWGLAQGMRKDVGRAKVAAQVAASILAQAKANFK